MCDWDSEKFRYCGQLVDVERDSSEHSLGEHLLAHSDRSGELRLRDHLPCGFTANIRGYFLRWVHVHNDEATSYGSK